MNGKQNKGESVRIIQLHSENVKRLKVVEIKPGDNNIVVIGGANGSGKSSTLDSIFYALAGNAALPGKPVRKGQEKAVITVDLGDLVVTKTIEADGTASLKVKSKAGVPQRSPQTILDDLVGNLTFDPTTFARMKPRDQLDLLKGLVGMDTQALDDEKASIALQRTECGRALKQLEGQLDGMPYDETAPAEMKSAVTLQQMIQEARAVNQGIDAKKREHGRAREELGRIANKMAAIKEELKRLEDLEAKVLDDAERLVSEIEGCTPRDEAGLIAQIDNIHLTNAIVAANKAKDLVRDKVNGGKLVYEAYTEKLQSIDQKKAEALAKVKFPVPTLSFGDDGVLVAGVPFEQASAAEQLRISLAMGMALNPRLRVMLIRDGSLLDANSMKIVEEMATGGDFQIWMERVGEGDETAVIIENGLVKS